MKKSTKNLLFLFTIFLLNIPKIYSQSIIYVDSDATGINDGSSWTNAYTELYDAISNASLNDSIWVAEGTYYPELNATPRLSTFLIDKQISLFGGFNGTETVLSQRNYVLHPTILSGDIGTPGDSTDNAYHVLSYGIGSTDITLIDGFIIQYGFAGNNAGGDLSQGGAISMSSNDNNTIQNCILRNNTAQYLGGAIGIESCNNILVSNCYFAENHHTVWSADTDGGGAIGIFNNTTGSITIDNCVFVNNDAAGNGGAIHGDDGRGAVITNCTFTGNDAAKNGGAVYNYEEITGCIFEENTAIYGGALYHTLVNNSVINSVFSANTAADGGAIAYESNTTTIVNSVFLNNSAIGSNDAIYSVDSQPLDVTYCRVQEETAGVGNFNTDPGLEINTFYPLPNSPCIDAGNGDIAPTYDKEGNSRHDDVYTNNTGTGAINYTDIGIYEFQAYSSLSGSYTIGTSGDFTSFTEAIVSLISLGINDTVTFSVEAGTYTEQLVIPEIAGATDSSIIIFQGATGDSTDVVLTYAATLAEENYTVKLEGADYITFENMTLQASGSAYGRIIEVTNGTKHNQFLNNRFEGIENTSELVFREAIAMPRDSSILFNNNYFLNGQYAISWNSAYNLDISNNSFLHQSDTTLYLQYCYETTINNNTIYSKFSQDAITLEDNRTFYYIENNKIYLPQGGNGMIVKGRSETDTSLITDNYIYLNTTNIDNGIELVNMGGLRLKLLHNTVNISGNNTSSACLVFDSYDSPSFFSSRNNNFVNMAGGVLLSGNYSRGDYNNLYTTGSAILPGISTLEVLQDIYHHEPNSVSVNPRFTSDTSWTPTHPFLNNTGSSEYTDETDIEGKTRNTDNPDLGVCEFTPNPVPFSGTFSIGGSTPDYETIEEAVDNLIINGVNGSVVFTLENDTFPEVVHITEIDGASVSNTITFESVGSDTAVITSDYDYTLWLDGTDYLRLNKIKIITENNRGAKTILLGNGATNNQIINSMIAQYASASFYASQSYLIHSESPGDSGMVISNNKFIGGANGVFLSGTDVNPQTGNIITGNTFTNMSMRGIQINGQEGFIIESNKIKNAIYRAIEITNGDSGLISNNMIYTYNHTGSPQGINISGSNKQYIYHNTIKLDQSFSSSVVLSLDASNTELKNNILCSNSSYVISCADSTGFISDNNLIFSNYARMTNWLGSDVLGFEAWQDSTGQDIHSYSFEPEFLSETDLHISDLRLNNVGIPIPEVITDIDGETRDASNPDIGADEVGLGNPMAGTYHIGSSRLFTSFVDAVDSILQVGVVDSVTFLVDAGTYNEQIEITHIPMSSADRPVVFTSASGNADDVILKYRPTHADTNYVIQMDSVFYLTMNNMTINSLDTTYGTALRMINGCNTINISENIITSDSSIVSSVVVAENGLNNNLLIANNTIRGGLAGVYFIGESGAMPSENIVIGNTFENQNNSGIYMRYEQQQIINNNEIKHDMPIETDWQGISLFYCSSTLSTPALIANNMIHFNANQQSSGITLADCNYQNIFHNSINIYGDAEESRALNIQGVSNYINVFNNIFSNTANGLVIYSSGSTIRDFDYNVLDASGTRFIYTTDWVNSLEDWNAIGKGVHSITIDPLFVSDTDLHINQIQLFNAGKSLPEVTNDFDGDPRDEQNPTIGADVISVNCSEPLSGIYSVGPGEGYESLGDAVNALVSCGMSGTVEFEILPGTYNEQIYLHPDYIGKTLNDSVIFRSASNQPEDVIISYAGTEDANYIINIDGLDNFVLQGVTLEAAGNDYGRLIEISGNSKNCVFLNNIFDGIVHTEDNTSFAMVYYPSSSVDSSQYFINNTFNYGSWAVNKQYISILSDNFHFESNHFNNQGYGAIYLNNTERISFIKNTINAQTEQYECIKVIGDSSYIARNVVNVEANRGNFMGYPQRSALIENNYVSYTSTDNTSLYLIYPGENLYLYYNTMAIKGVNPDSRLLQLGGNTCNYLEQKNNVMVNLAGGTVYQIYFDIATVLSDHNNLFTTGSMFGNMEGVVYSDFSEYVSLTGLDNNSTSANPAFLNDSTWYSQHILHSNTGIPIADITTDLEGNPRDASTPDMGAEEFLDVRYSLGEDVRVCADDSYLINAGYGFDSYEWSNGSDSSVTLVDTSGVGQGIQEIYVHVGLNGNQYYDTILINLSSPIATPISEYCFNENEDSIMITAGEGVDYSWNTGQTTQSIYINGGNWHYVTVTDEYGCSSDGSIYIHYNNCVADFNMPSDSVITEADSVVIQANSSCETDYNYFHYQWSTGDTLVLITVKGSELGIGTHKISCTITNLLTNNCQSVDSITITVETPSGIGNKGNINTITFYPNPTTGIVYINSQNEHVQSIEMYNLQGKLLFKSKEGNIDKIDISSYKAGMYLIKINTDKQSFIKRLLLE